MKVTIHQSLLRENLVLGGDADLVRFSALISIIVGIGGATPDMWVMLLSVSSAGLFWVVSVILLRMLAKRDPKMVRCWLRHVSKQEFYPARGSRWRVAGGYQCH